MFKGPNQDIEAIYTASSSTVCGVTLDTNGKEYLITGITATTLLVIKCVNMFLIIYVSSYYFLHRLILISLYYTLPPL